jgi:hypothetical protein
MTMMGLVMLGTMMVTMIICWMAYMKIWMQTRMQGASFRHPMQNNQLKVGQNRGGSSVGD